MEKIRKFFSSMLYPYHTNQILKSDASYPIQVIYCFSLHVATTAARFFSNIFIIITILRCGDNMHTTYKTHSDIHSAYIIISHSCVVHICCCVVVVVVVVVVIFIDSRSSFDFGTAHCCAFFCYLFRFLGTLVLFSTNKSELVVSHFYPHHHFFFEEFYSLKRAYH